MKNFKFKEDEIQPVIRESVDRNTCRVKGELPKDEDEELVNRNNPSNKFIKPEDIESDHSLPDEFEDENYNPLSPSENEENLLFEDEAMNDFSEKNDDDYEIEMDDENKISNQEYRDIERKKLYQVREAIKENKGKIGSASVSVDEGKVDIYREPATEKDAYNFVPMTKEEKEILMEEYSSYDEALPSRKIRSEAYKDFMINSKLDQRASQKHGQSHRGENMKTMSDKKLQKQNRSLLRKLFGKWHNTKSKEHEDYL